MAFEIEQREARRLLDGIEMGTMDAWDSFRLIETADPTLVYFVFTWLRSRYANDPAAEGVIGRIVAICTDHPATLRILKKGESDALVTWFEETYAYRDFTNEEFVRVVVEKLES